MCMSMCMCMGVCVCEYVYVCMRCAEQSSGSSAPSKTEAPMYRACLSGGLASGGLVSGDLETATTSIISSKHACENLAQTPYLSKNPRLGMPEYTWGEGPPPTARAQGFRSV